MSAEDVTCFDAGLEVRSSILVISANKTSAKRDSAVKTTYLSMTIFPSTCAPPYNPFDLTYDQTGLASTPISSMNPFPIGPAAMETSAPSVTRGLAKDLTAASVRSRRITS